MSPTKVEIRHACYKALWQKLHPAVLWALLYAPMGANHGSKA